MCYCAGSHYQSKNLKEKNQTKVRDIFMAEEEVCRKIETLKISYRLN